VVRVEDTDGGDTVLINDVRDSRKNIRPRGRTSRLAPRWSGPDPDRPGAGRGAGNSACRVDVHRRPVCDPRPAIFGRLDRSAKSAGSKIVSNSYTLSALVRVSGAVPLLRQRRRF
jgi:hypothetical protein